MEDGLQQNVITIDGRDVPITLKANRRARRFIVRVHPITGEVAVTAPSKTSFPHALNFAKAERRWIAKQLASVPETVPFLPGAIIPFHGTLHQIEHAPTAKGAVWLDTMRDQPAIVSAGAEPHVPRRVKDWLKRQARKEFDVLVNEFSTQIGHMPKRLSIRDPETRWGSCATNGAMSFSWRLVMAPQFVMRYVAAHEMAHLVHMHHRATFWRLVDTLVDDVPLAKEWLNSHGSQLHRYG